MDPNGKPAPAILQAKTAKVQLANSLRTLRIHSFITGKEYERAAKRFRKWLEDHNCELTNEELNAEVECLCAICPNHNGKTCKFTG